MPPPRRHSPGRRDRRSRSRSRSHSPRSSYKKRRSPSPRSRGRSKSPRRSRSRERKRSKSPYNKRKNSRTPERRKSTGSKRKSSSPHDYDLPIKRQADSTRRSYRSRSRSQSPGPSKKSKSSRRSPSPYDGKLYSDERSHSSSKKLRKQEIDMVKIVDQGKKMDKLDKRFQTLEQLAQGSFDPEENITIGIHRGPHHVDLDEDVECKYDFNPKLFVMLYPKKDYSAPIFDRDEIKMFNHDSILDEEAYVEKRTITVKPTDKPKASSSKYRDMDYKITVGAGRDKYGDKRMVLDTSRSSRHDPEVKIRLDAKPDPKYERLYKAQQRYEERGVHDDDIKRNPSDLRYNLMRRRSSERERDRDSERGRREENSMMDARSRIEAKRKGLDKGSHGERGVRDLSPPETRIEKRKVGIRTELPDFKNRPAGESVSPGRKHQFSDRWGYCEICNVPINSEIQAMEHVRGFQHIQNETEKDRKTGDRSPDRRSPDRRSPDERSRDVRSPVPLFINGRRVVEDDDVESDMSHKRSRASSMDDKFQYDNWEVNPAVTPKGSSYYEHDNRSREDMTFWERKQMYLKTGRTPPSRGLIRGRGRGRIVSQGISRGITRPFNNSRPFNSQPLQSRPPNRPRTAAMDEWKHDKFSEVETDDNITEPKRVGDVESRVTKSTNKDRSTKERSEKDSKEKLSDARYRIDRKGNKGEERKDGKGGNNQTVKVKRENLDIIKEEAALNMDSNISVTME